MDLSFKASEVLAPENSSTPVLPKSQWTTEAPYYHTWQSRLGRSQKLRGKRRRCRVENHMGVEQGGVALSSGTEPEKRYSAILHLNHDHIPHDPSFGGPLDTPSEQETMLSFRKEDDCMHLGCRGIPLESQQVGGSRGGYTEWHVWTTRWAEGIMHSIRLYANSSTSQSRRSSSFPHPHRSLCPAIYHPTCCGPALTLSDSKDDVEATLHYDR